MNNKKQTKTFRDKMIKRMKKKGLEANSIKIYLHSVDHLIINAYEETIIKKTGLLGNDKELSKIDVYTETAWELIYLNLLKPVFNKDMSKACLMPCSNFIFEEGGAK